MSGQLQCPNCGGFKITDKVIHLDAATQKPITKIGGCGCLFMSFALLGGVVQILAPWASTSKQNEPIALAILIGVAILLFTLYLAAKRGNNRDRSMAQKKHELNCDLCGYRWQWTEGAPYPNVTVNPDLIAKGEAQLQAQAQARRDAEGAFYLYQQRHKK